MKAVWCLRDVARAQCRMVFLSTRGPAGCLRRLPGARLRREPARLIRMNGHKNSHVVARWAYVRTEVCGGHETCRERRHWRIDNGNRRTPRPGDASLIEPAPEGENPLKYGVRISPR